MDSTIDMTLTRQEALKLLCKRKGITLVQIFKTAKLQFNKGERKLLTWSFTPEEIKAFEKALDVGEGFFK